MRKLLQQILLVLGVIALVALIADIILSLALTTPASTPARVVNTKAGPYDLTVKLSRDPTTAGYAFPFSITASQPLTYKVSSVPAKDVNATAVNASMSNGGNEVQGVAEITVQGRWELHIIADGPQGKGETIVPIEATAPAAIPTWTGWLIGGIFPLSCFVIFLFIHTRKRPDKQLPLAVTT